MKSLFSKQRKKKEPTDLMQMIKANINSENPALILVKHDGRFKGYNAKGQSDHTLSEVPYYGKKHPGTNIIQKWLNDLGFTGIQGYKFITEQEEEIFEL